MKIICILPLVGACVLALGGCSQSPVDRADAATVLEDRAIDVTSGRLTVRRDVGANGVAGLLDAADRNAGTKGVQAGDALDKPANLNF